MIDFFYSIDLMLFYFFNHTIANPVFTKFFSHITNVNNWYILYIVIIGILITKGGRRGRIAALMVLVLVAFSDATGHRILKEFFERARPCNALVDAITPLGRNGTFSFPSNHAFNSFAVATFFYKLYPKLKWVLLITAALVAISRVYLGLHYPSDIVAGALLGILVGYGFAYFQTKYLKG